MSLPSLRLKANADRRLRAGQNQLTPHTGRDGLTLGIVERI